MVFGLGRGGGQPAAPAMGGGVTSPQLEAATAELDMITDAFNKLVSVCHNKCISTRYLEPDLNKGESVCVDRCVSKFFQVNAKVGEKMQTIGQQGAGAAGGSGGGSFF